MASLNAKSFDTPDETRTPDKTKIDVVDLGGPKAARMTAQPGWRWSDCIKPVVGGDSCQTHHLGVVGVACCTSCTTTAPRSRSAPARRTRSSPGTTRGSSATSRSWPTSSTRRRRRRTHAPPERLYPSPAGRRRMKRGAHGCVASDDPHRRVEDHAVSGLVSDHGGTQRVDGACRVCVVVESFEHPAEQAEHEPLRVVGVGAEPHGLARRPRARCR